MADTNDIVLIYLEESPVSFARVESILPDAKKDWYHIKLLMLQIPLQVVTWILKDVYINGETFFMNGKQMRLKKVECPPDDPQAVSELRPGPKGKEALSRTDGSEKDRSAPDRETGNIISFADLKQDPQK